MQNPYSFDFKDFDFEKYRRNSVNQKGLKGHILAVVVTIIIWLFINYMFYPVYNFQSYSSLITMGFVLGVFGFIDMLFTLSFNKVVKIVIGVLVSCLLVTIVLSIMGSTFFNASRFQQQLAITEVSNFDRDFKAISLQKIPIVDKEAAIKLGDKKMGEVSGLGSQFYVGDNYTLISSNSNLYRLAPLEFQDIIKWWQNKDNGVPGYIQVNVNDPNDVQLKLLEKGMKYMPSAYFNYNLYRHVRFNYPTELITDYSFEVDDSGKPYWVISVYRPEVGFFSGPNASGVILCDPVTGELQKYDLSTIPSWVDRVQPLQFAWSQLDNWGRYVHGFFNTIFGQKDMLQTTDGYNYVNIDGKTHAFTGMTSVGSERSIVGFALINLEDKSAKFYKIGGADEVSAMESAQGQVQNLKYKASFPILLNVAKQPTYYLSLKDDAGLVKMYSFVNVTNYTIVGVGYTLAEAQADYIKKLGTSGISIGEITDGFIEISAEISSVTQAIFEGNSLYYFTVSGSNKLFVIPLALASELPLTKIGDMVKIKYVDDENPSIVPLAFDNLEYEY